MNTHCIAAAIVAAVAGCALAAPAAPASTIAYRCGPSIENLCTINPDGTGRRQLTTDGTADFPYTWPSLTRDGTKLAYVVRNELYVRTLSTGARVGPVTRGALLVTMRPDGGRIGAIDLYPSPTGIGLNPIACSFDAAGGDRNCTLSTSTLGWSADGRLLIDRDAGNAAHTQGICAITRLPDGTHDCAPFVAVHPERNLRDPAVSPDGRTVAATAEEPNTAAGKIVLFDAATGAPRRDLTTGTVDGQPAWSPDGSSIAFERNRSIFVISANGAPGSERLLTAGSSPSWGGPKDAAAPTPLASGIRIPSSQRGTKVRVTLTLGRGGATVRVRLTLGRRGAGSLTLRNQPTGKHTYSARVSRSVAARLRRGARVRLGVGITVEAPGAAPTRSTRTVTLRR